MDLIYPADPSFSDFELLQPSEVEFQQASLMLCQYAEDISNIYFKSSTQATTEWSKLYFEASIKGTSSVFGHRYMFASCLLEASNHISGCRDAAWLRWAKTTNIHYWHHTTKAEKQDLGTRQRGVMLHEHHIDYYKQQWHTYNKLDVNVTEIETK